MKSYDANELYDAHYFAHGCGVPYERNEHWLTFFTAIAEVIARDMQPRTVLDAGCAMGFLVEKLRERDIEAYGVDISEYAIENVHESVRPYCWQGSITDPFPRAYDLIVCIEVVEHMRPWDAEQAIENMCLHAEEVIFSSTPFDYRESSHFSVRPPEHWASLFAQQGFYRDVDFDASFVTPWAGRFRRRRDPVARILGEYERRFWLLWKENTDLRSLTVEMREHDRNTEQTVAVMQQEIQTQKDYIELLKNHYDDQIKILSAEKERVVASMTASIEEIHHSGKKAIARVVAEKEAIDQELTDRVSQLENLLEEKNAHIGHLENLLREIEQGNVMRLLRSLTILRQQGVGAAIQAFRQPPIVAHEPDNRKMICNVDDYQAWVIENEPDLTQLHQQRQESLAFPFKPLISIITPVYNTPSQVLHDTIESVLAQTYPNWEMCLVDGASTAAGVRETLARFDQQDSRIHVHYLTRNMGISGNSNEALRHTSGDFVLLLDHDDLLAPDLLYEVVRLLNEHPVADIIYYDEDKISDDGVVRSYPVFKPSRWSPDLLLATNYLTHCVVRRALIFAVGAFNPAMDGSQDWDLALRLTEKTQRIFHIPRVLYHWRMISGSVAREFAAKPWAFETQPRCVAAHLQRIGIDQPRVTVPRMGELRILWPISGQRISIIIAVEGDGRGGKDGTDRLEACLASILEHTTYPDYEIILVYSGSPPPERLPTRKTLTQQKGDFARVRTIHHDALLNRFAANNVGAHHATGNLLVFLNQHTEVLDPYWLDELAGWAEQPEVGVVGCKLLQPDNTIQHAGIIIGLEGFGGYIFAGKDENQFGVFGKPEWYRNCMAVSGVCLMIRREVFEEVNRFDEVYQASYSDIELCLQASRCGYRVTYTPFARLRSYDEAATNPSACDVLRAYFRLLPAVLAGDPYFNPNLSYAHHIPTIARKEEHSRHDHLVTLLETFDLLEPGGGGVVAEHDTIIEWAHQLHHSFSAAQQRTNTTQKRILIVSPKLDLSDTSLALTMLARYLVDNGCSVTVLSIYEGPLAGNLAEYHIEVMVDPTIQDDARVTFLLLQDYDLVLVNTLTCWRAVVAARAFRKPCIWWIHEQPSHGQWLAPNGQHVALALRAADALVFPSQATANLYRRFICPEAAQTIHPIHHGLDVGIIEHQKNLASTFEEEQEDGRFRVVCVGPIGPRKGQDVLMQAVAALPNEVAGQFDIYLPGGVLDYDFHHALQETVKSLPGARIHIGGELSRQQITSYLQAADVVVVPSRDESLPVSLLEAMFHQKAIVASNTGGIPEVITHKENGLLFEVEDYSALSRHLNQLFREPVLRHSLGKNAYDSFQSNFTVDRFGQEWLELIGRFVSFPVGHSSPEWSAMNGSASVTPSAHADPAEEANQVSPTNNKQSDSSEKQPEEIAP